MKKIILSTFVLLNFHEAHAFLDYLQKKAGDAARVVERKAKDAVLSAVGLKPFTDLLASAKASYQKPPKKVANPRMLIEDEEGDVIGIVAENGEVITISREEREALERDIIDLNELLQRRNTEYETLKQEEDEMLIQADALKAQQDQLNSEIAELKNEIETKQTLFQKNMRPLYDYLDLESEAIGIIQAIENNEIED